MFSGATACQKIPEQGYSEQNKSQFNFVDGTCVGGRRGWCSKTPFPPRSRERSIDRDRDRARQPVCMVVSGTSCFVEDGFLASENVKFPSHIKD